MRTKDEVNVKDIDNVTMAQIQQGKKGENGPVVVTLIRFKSYNAHWSSKWTISRG